ncbi:MAG: pyroglutamyl-peptidase I [Brachybacterium sp.]|nr:pyroglutamyl-peptidase I [Brachybacterium sp.]
MSIEVLLSGFEPFDGAATNPSWEAVHRAAELLRAEGITAQPLLLPVEFTVAAERLIAAARELRPDLVIAVGLAAGRTAITPERVAVNIQDARIPDNAGAAPVDVPCVSDGPVGYFSTLPIKAMTAAMSAIEGVTATVSQTAGTYVCNDVFYQLQHALDVDVVLHDADIRGGFVHIPEAEVIGVDAVARALVAGVHAARTHRADRAISGGTEH